jgi:hypothetical protein
MTTKHNFRLVTIIVAIIILIATIATVSCNTNNEYQKVTVTKGGVRFSFEYPSSYQDKNGDLKDSSLLKGIFIFKRVSNNSTWENPDTIFSLNIYYPSEFRPDAKAKLDELLKTVESTDPNTKFNLLERSNLNISNINGELLSYSKIYGSTHFFYILYFDYKGLIWSLIIDSLETTSVQAKTEFDHIIKTFKFLD